MRNHIQFQQSYNVAALEAELAWSVTKEWQNHFNKKDYDGAWQSISLRSVSGLETDIYAHYNASGYQNTQLLNHLPYIKSIIDSWHCDKESIRLLALYPGSEIKPHRDFGCSYQDGTFRLHVPIVTNDQVTFNVAGERLKLNPGTCWYINFNETHWIKNDGNNIRVHLIIDCLRNEWTDQLFAANGYDLTADQKGKVYDEDTKLRMLQELEKMDNPGAKKLIEELKKAS